MTDLISILQQDHLEIKNSLDKIRQIGFFNKEARVELKLVQDFFLKHMEKEEAEVYRTLKEAASDNKHLLQLYKHLEDEASLISKFAAIFFDKYSSKDASLEGFDREFQLIYSTMLKRIEKEEKILFSAYDKLIEQNVLYPKGQ